TGTVDSKFGAPVGTGEALAQAQQIARAKGLALVGIHAHIGAQVRDARPYGELARALVAFAKEVHAATGAPITELGMGGGVAVRYCESGDVLIRSVRLPTEHSGDLLAIPAAGAYSVAMSSNYNETPRPAVVLLDGARARVIRERETIEDIWRLERR